MTNLTRALGMLFLAVDYLQVYYGIAGMETQLAVAILLVGAVVVTGKPRPVWRGRAEGRQRSRLVVSGLP